MQLCSVLARSGNSVTFAGDPMQARRRRFRSSLDELQSSVPDSSFLRLRFGYRVPVEIMQLASRVGMAFMPEATPAEAIRKGIRDPELVIQRTQHHASWIARFAIEETGSIGVIAAQASRQALTDPDSGDPVHAKVRVISPEAARGLEFDHVIVMNPSEFVQTVDDLGVLYLAMTHPTTSLTVLTAAPLPDCGVDWPDQWRAASEALGEEFEQERLAALAARADGQADAASETGDFGATAFQAVSDADLIRMLMDIASELERRRAAATGMND